MGENYLLASMDMLTEVASVMAIETVSVTMVVMLLRRVLSVVDIEKLGVKFH